MGHARAPQFVLGRHAGEHGARAAAQRRSTTATFLPDLPRRQASCFPPWPLPGMTTSNCSNWDMFSNRFANVLHALGGQIRQCRKDGMNLHIRINPAFPLRAGLGCAQRRRSGTSDARRRRARRATTTKDLEALEPRTNRDLVRAFRPDDEIRLEAFSRLIRTAGALQMGGVYGSPRCGGFANPAHSAILFLVSISRGGQVNDNMIRSGCHPSAPIGIREGTVTHNVRHRDVRYEDGEQRRKSCLKHGLHRPEWLVSGTSRTDNLGP